MTAHTPGPWQVKHRRLMKIKGSVHQVYQPTDEGGYPTAFVPAWDDPAPGEVDGTEEAIANAQLIAAAPELLNALVLVVNTYGWDPSIDSAIWQTAFAAIAKALGETK